MAHCKRENNLQRSTKTHFVQPQQREGQSQAQPEGIRGGPEVQDEAITRPFVRARGHHPEKEHHREETAQTDGEIKQYRG